MHGERWWRPAFSIGFVLHSCAWGMYFAATRPLISKVLGGGSAALMILVGIEWIAAIFAIAGGYVADRFGRRFVTSLGLVGFLGFVGMSFSKNAMHFLLYAFVASVSWGFTWPSVVSPTVLSERTASEYGRATVGAPLGWGIGSVMTGMLANDLGFDGCLLLAGFLYLCAYAIFTAFYPRTSAEASSLRSTEVLRLVAKIARISVALTTITAGVELGLNIYALRLYEIVLQTFPTTYANLAYGLLYGGIPCFLGSPAKLIAAKIAERMGYDEFASMVGIAYAITFLAMWFAPRMLFIVLWCLPLYPCLDIAAYSMVTSRAPTELKAFSAGAVLTSMSVGGGLVALTSPIVASLGDFVGILVSIALLTISTMLIAVPKILE